MSSSDVGVGLAKRLVVSALVAALVVGAAFATAATTDPAADRAAPDAPEYDLDALATTPIPATGAVEADVDDRDGVVVIDQAHSNRFDRADVAPLVEELTALGYDVRFHEGSDNLDTSLGNANAFVVIDPAEEYERHEFVTVRSFTREGGHLLLVGEPTRARISSGFSGVSVSRRESALTTLAGRYDMSLGTAYLYNLETNGGNYKHVVAEPTPESGLDLGRVTLFTAAPVSSRAGTVLLRAAENTHRAGADEARRYPVAIYRERANVVLIGDSSFLRADRFNVGHNERFVAFLVEYLASGEETSPPTVDQDDDEGTE